MVGLLLPRGASSAKVDWQCWTAYDVAIFAGHRQVACRLEKLAERSSSVAPGRRHHVAATAILVVTQVGRSSGNV
jgi:hypothetical protein